MTIPLGPTVTVTDGPAVARSMYEVDEVDWFVATVATPAPLMLSFALVTALSARVLIGSVLTNYIF